MSSGDDGARERRFRRVHAATYPDLLRFVQRRVPPSEAEDVVSTVFLTAWRRLDDVPGSITVLVHHTAGTSAHRIEDL